MHQFRKVLHHNMRLLFADVPDAKVVRPSMRAVAGWLALSDDMVFETLRDHAEADPERVPEFTGVILSEANRLRARVQQMLDVATGEEF